MPPSLTGLLAMTGAQFGAAFALGRIVQLRRAGIEGLGGFCLPVVGCWMVAVMPLPLGS